jgi:methylmalonyl-CoA mutase N-terminal domain/subunit
MGVMLKDIENGLPQREILESSFDYQKAVETQDAVVVGVNKFQIAEETTIPILKVDEKIERSQIERLRAVREKRDAKKAETALAKLEEGARGNENLLPRILDCVENYVTVGEISHRLRHVWGEYREAVAL